MHFTSRSSALNLTHSPSSLDPTSTTYPSYSAKADGVFASVFRPAATQSHLAGKQKHQHTH